MRNKFEDDMTTEKLKRHFSQLGHPNVKIKLVFFVCVGFFYNTCYITTVSIIRLIETYDILYILYIICASNFHITSKFLIQYEIQW